MAYVSTNPVSVGDQTKKPHYDQVLDNTTWIHDTLLGVSGDAGTRLGAASAIVIEGMTWYNVIAYAAADTDQIGVSAGTSGITGAGWRAYGQSHGTLPGALELVAGNSNMATGGATMYIRMFERSTSGSIDIARFAKGAVTWYTNVLQRDIDTGTLQLSGGAGTPAAKGGLVLAGPSFSGAYGAQLLLASGRYLDIYSIGSSATVARILDTGQVNLYNGGNVRAIMTSASGYGLVDLRDSAGGTTVYLDSSTGQIRSGTSTGDRVYLDDNYSAFLVATNGGGSFTLGGSTTGSSANGNFFLQVNSGKYLSILADHVVMPKVTTSPASPQAGSVYYDTTANKLKVYNGSAWETITSA